MVNPSRQTDIAKGPSTGQNRAASDPIVLAMAICAKRGVRLTDLRRQILELLWESGRATGAYDLMEALQQKVSRPIAPPTVYRALEFLIAQGLVSKIESRNAYVPCAHPERENDCVFFVCRECGLSVELEDPKIDRLLADNAALVGFLATRSVVEVEGVCADCHENGTVPA